MRPQELARDCTPDADNSNRLRRIHLEKRHRKVTHGRLAASLRYSCDENDGYLAQLATGMHDLTLRNPAKALKVTVAMVRGGKAMGSDFDILTI